MQYSGFNNSRILHFFLGESEYTSFNFSFGYIKMKKWNVEIN